MVLELVQVYPPKIASISNVQWTNIASELNVWGRGQTLKVIGIYRGQTLQVRGMYRGQTQARGMYRGQTLQRRTKNMAGFVCGFKGS